MKGLGQRLPPIRGLVAFEAAARHANFTRAAAELGITQAAVSRQIGALEQFLATPLFQRIGRSVALTPQGRQLQQAVTTGLDHIALVIDELRRPYAKAPVAVTTTIALASLWLLPRIATFRSLNPEIDLKIVASDLILNLARDGIDVGIRYGMGRWAGVTAERLFAIEMFPVCSPAYFRGRPPLAKPDELLGETLLHLDEPNSRDADWAVWLRAVGQEPPHLTGGLRFNNYPLLVQAALDGQGMALGWGHLLDDYLLSGALVRALDVTVRLDPAFYLALPADGSARPEVETFRHWLLAETAPLRRRG